jgi:hypothetical protein
MFEKMISPPVFVKEVVILLALLNGMTPKQTIKWIEVKKIFIKKQKLIDNLNVLDRNQMFTVKRFEAFKQRFDE